jgi:hypothetical protein
MALLSRLFNRRSDPAPSSPAVPTEQQRSARPDRWQTATSDDFAGVLSSKLPLFIGVVVLLSFLLLTAVFRSLLIPAVAALMNLLTAG